MTKILAYLSLTNTLGLVVTEIEHGIDDTITTAFQDDTGRLFDSETSTLTYDDDRLIFYRSDNDEPYCLEDFMKLTI